MMTGYLIACFYLHNPISVVEKYKGPKRARFREQKTTIQKQTNNNNKTKTHTKTTTKNKHKNKIKKLLDVITFQIVLYYAFGEITYIIWYEGQKKKSQFCQMYVKKIMSGVKLCK